MEPVAGDNIKTVRKVVGRPFPPGVSGNPAGGPKDVVGPLARTHTKEAIERLVTWMRSSNPKASVAATIALLNRGWGMPGQALELGGPNGSAVVVNIVNFAGSSIALGLVKPHLNGN